MACIEKMPPYFKLDKLMTDITECISSLTQEFSCMNIPIDDSCTIFHRFCSKLEHILSLGLKEKSNLFGKRRGYWDFMLKSLISNRGGVHEGLKFVKNNPELKTSIGRGRAFLRFCLVHQCLADTMQQCFSGPMELTIEWYADWAPVRDDASLRLLLTSLYDLNEVQFDLSSPSCHDLDISWPTFNRKEFGSPFSWKAVSRSASISSLTSSLSAVDNLNSLRGMGAMGSVQEGSEGGGGGEGNSASGLEDQSQRNDLREQSEEKEVWWMSEQEIPGQDSSQDIADEAHVWVEERKRHDTEAEEKLKSLQEEVTRREEEWKRREAEWKSREEEWKSTVEEWEKKERSWRGEHEVLEKGHAVQLDEFRSCEEERKVEIDVLKARVLELEVVKVMAECASIGVQATNEDEMESEKQKRINAEERLASILSENEELKKALEQMKIASKEVEFKCSTSELLTHHMESKRPVVSDLKPQVISKNDDDLRREYESQIQNVRELRGMYEDRMKAAEEQSRKLREALQDKNRRLELSQKRCSELRAHAEELGTLLGEQEGIARGLQARLSASLEEGRVLATQLTTVNRLFGRLGDTAELDFERLRLLQNSAEGEAGEDGDGGTNDKGDGKEETTDLREIAVSLPKVWRLLVELLGEEQKEEEEEEEASGAGTDGCFDSVPTPYGPRLVISVSRTFIRLKDLILEKKSLQNELGRIRDLNGRLESKLKQQERRLATVKLELKRTWSLVSKMRAQHRQLHTSEQVLRYELQQKRKLLGELKKELEYCREKWDLARLKNSQSEKEWQLLRQEFTARRSADAGRDSTEANSPESGFSDGRGEDEEEEVDGAIGDCESVEVKDVSKCPDVIDIQNYVSHDPLTTPLLPPEENQVPPLNEEVHVENDECSIQPMNFNSPDTIGECVGNSNGVPVLNNNSASTQETSDIPIPQTEVIPSAECASSANNSHSFALPTQPDSEVAPQPGVSAERSMEERLLARAERLRRLEEQCNLLFKKVTRTTTRSTELSNRLEELHEQYGDTSGGSRRGSPVHADTETGEAMPEATACSSMLKSATIPSEILTSTPPTPPPPPPPPPPLPDILPAIRLPSLVEHTPRLPSVSISSEPSTPLTDAVVSSVASLGNVQYESVTDIRQENEQINYSLQTQSVLEEDSNNVVDPSNAITSELSEEPQDILTSTPQNVSENGHELVSSDVDQRSDSVVEEPSSDSQVTEIVPPAIQNNDVENHSLSPAVFDSPLEPDETLGRAVEETNEEAEASSGSTQLVQNVAAEIFGGIIEEEDEEGVSGGEEEEEMNLDTYDGFIGEESVEDTMEEREDIDEEEAYIERISSTIYGLNHGPLFDEGGTSVSEDEDGEGIAEDEDDDDIDGDGLSENAVTSGSIGVASLLLQQLPKRMDILRRERHSMEQRLEEGEAALERALASTAAAEQRSRMLERGLAQAQERLRVLEMETAVERNKRLLEIKSSLDAAADKHVEEGGSRNVQHDAVQTSSGSLQEEIDHLQRQTLAQIAEFKAAAVISQAQKEQLNTLSDEVERQEKIVNLLEGELSSLRLERKEQAKSLEDASERLNDALELLSSREEESREMHLQVEKLRSELEHSTEENKELSSKLMAAEAQVNQLVSEIEQLKDDSVRLQEVVVKLTGEKESLFRANHRLEEMRRLVLEDPKWVSDRESDVCTACGVTFSLMIRRHHCRSCGKIFCGACSSHWLTLNSGPSSQGSSLVAGVVESIIGSGKRSRACAECFAAYATECAEVDSSSPRTSHPHSRGEMSGDGRPGSSKSPDTVGSNCLEGSEDPELLCGIAEGEDDSKEEDDEDDVEDFSMISEEEVFLSQCTPYVPNPITLQYWKSCEIQSGVISSASDLLAACIPENGVPGKGRVEEVWVRAGAIYSVPLLIEEKRIDVLWEFSTNPNSIAFSVLYKSSMDVPMSSALIVVPTTRVNSHLTPTRGRLRPKRAGVYILMFDNSFSRFTGKTISYCLRAEVLSKVSGGRESVTSSSRSSVEPFPDLPIHEEAEMVERERENDEDNRNEVDKDVSSRTTEDQGLPN